MRVELPSKGPGQPAAGDPAAVPTSSPPPVAGAPPNVAAARRESTRERWLRNIVQWRVAIPVLALSATILGWEWIGRAPLAKKPMVVQARETTATGTNPPATAESLAALKDEQARRLGTLVQSRKEIPPLLTSLEQQARALGWDCERSMKPPVPAPYGLTNLTLHPVTLHLAIGEQQRSSPYVRLAAWLRAVASLPVRAEIVGVDLRADGAGLNAADIRLQFFSANTHAEVASK